MKAGPLGFLLALALPLTVLGIGCGGGGGSSATPATNSNSSGGSTTSSGSTVYVAAYKAAKWGSAATVSFSGTCSMTLTTTGVPPSHTDYYLAPVSTQYPDSVAVSPATHTEMSVVPYMPSAITSATVTFNVCPSKASSTTATGHGPIGFTISGEAIFNAFEGDGSTPALTDNVSYSFTTAAGKAETASFIDGCNSHPTPLSAGYEWHHHAVPACLVAQIDGSNGPSHLIGIALDGYPIYGGRDIDGKTIAVAQLDACNGITSATPEFPSGIYHYVLPVGVTGKQSSLNCYSGTVSHSQMALASRHMCGLDSLDKTLQTEARDRRRRLALHPLRSSDGEAKRLSAAVPPRRQTRGRGIPDVWTTAKVAVITI